MSNKERATIDLAHAKLINPCPACGSALETYTWNQRATFYRWECQTIQWNEDDPQESAVCRERQQGLKREESETADAAPSLGRQTVKVPVQLRFGGPSEARAIFPWSPQWSPNGSTQVIEICESAGEGDPNADLVRRYGYDPDTGKPLSGDTGSQKVNCSVHGPQKVLVCSECLVEAQDTSINKASEINEALEASGYDNPTSIIGVVQELRQRAEQAEAEWERQRQKAAQAERRKKEAEAELDRYKKAEYCTACGYAAWIESVETGEKRCAVCEARHQLRDMQSDRDQLRRERDDYKAAYERMTGQLNDEQRRREQVEAELEEVKRDRDVARKQERKADDYAKKMKADRDHYKQRCEEMEPVVEAATTYHRNSSWDNAWNLKRAIEQYISEEGHPTDAEKEAGVHAVQHKSSLNGIEASAVLDQDGDGTFAAQFHDGDGTHVGTGPCESLASLLLALVKDDPTEKNRPRAKGGADALVDIFTKEYGFKPSTGEPAEKFVRRVLREQTEAVKDAVERANLYCAERDKAIRAEETLLAEKNFLAEKAKLWDEARQEIGLPADADPQEVMDHISMNGFHEDLKKHSDLMQRLGVRKSQQQLIWDDDNGVPVAWLPWYEAIDQVVQEIGGGEAPFGETSPVPAEAVRMVLKPLDDALFEGGLKETALNADNLRWLAKVRTALRGGLHASSALTSIAMERKRQADEEGYSFSHDDEHRFGELAINAALLAIQHVDAPVARRAGLIPAVGLEGYAIRDPWGLIRKHGGGKATSHYRRLTIAGALLVAEMERLERAQQRADDQADDPLGGA